MQDFHAHSLKLILSLAVLVASAAACAQNKPVGEDASNAAQAGSPAASNVSGASSGKSDVLQQWLARNGLVQQVSTRASDLVVNALGFLGVRYKYGGDHASTGFDCSGFVRHVYQQTLGLVLPHSAAQQSREGEKISESQLRPGDLVFFNTLRRAFSHVGIYIGNGEFVHSPRPGQSVQISKLDDPYWARHFDGARRLITHAADPLPPAQAAAPGPDPSSGGSADKAAEQVQAQGSVSH
ncbi:MAG: C40 family peptidase [Betaproteobacteria bacterium]|jgi:cell wall-associated NlpC family hydrolase|nr:C40 family peptidase [Betaproteobacteria bacterium]OZB42218.1 MAG: hypothetical protein B7X46_14485 [Thiomonas sp. 15-66-11]